MTEPSQPNLTQHELYSLQRLRAAVAALQNNIASLPAKEVSNVHNEQFNQLRLEAKQLLKDEDFDDKVGRAVTEDVLAERLNKIVIPRLFVIIAAGVILALLGLGINSIILEDLIVNTLGCLISSGGMLLIIGALGIFGLANRQQRLSNYGDLYQACDALLYQIEHILDLSIPDWADRAEVEIPEVAWVLELSLDSLHRQADDWQQKLTDLEVQRDALGAESPQELTVTLDFVARELNRVNQEINVLNGRLDALLTEEEATPPLRPAPVAGTAQQIEIASANTLGMPVARPEGADLETAPEDE